MHSEARRPVRPVRAVLARLLGACAVLIGLFAMHGLPPSATGCHSGPAMPPSTLSSVEMASAMPAAPGAITVGAAAGPATRPSQPSGSARPEANSAGDGRGELCVSTAPRPDRDGAPAWVLLAAAALLAAAWLSATGDLAGVARRHGSPHRDPPPAGIVLLTRVCVSLT
ncbi:MAG: hypothetical protein ACRDSH_13895 [Pseudonocardiaceae bacterium]